MLGRDANDPIELDRVQQVTSPREDLAKHPWDVLCWVHYYMLKEEIMWKAWHHGPLDFDSSTVHLFPDLSNNTLHMRRVVRPLLDVICQVVATHGVSPLVSRWDRENNPFLF